MNELLTAPCRCLAGAGELEDVVKSAIAAVARRNLKHSPKEGCYAYSEVTDSPDRAVSAVMVLQHLPCPPCNCLWTCLDHKVCHKVWSLVEVISCETLNLCNSGLGKAVESIQSETRIQSHSHRAGHLPMAREGVDECSTNALR
jgi:hypothetical protein